MYKYMIHTCNDRRWYVNKFLISSMLEQGIQKDEIMVMVDTQKEGILLSTMKSFDWVGRTQDWDGIMWHLQDDVIISSDFKEQTDKLYGDIICGFCSFYDKSKRYGLVGASEMWYSFPCIGIKNFVAKEVAKWFFEDVIYNSEYKDMIDSKKHVDYIFREFIQEEYSRRSRIKIYNVNPNLVDHVDWLIGGSLINGCRKESQVRAHYWTNENLVKNLEINLNDYFKENVDN